MPNTDQAHAERWQYLREQTAHQLAVYRRRRRRDKRKAFGLRLAAVSLSATVTALVGLRTANAAAQPWLLNTALVLGALGTVLTSIDGFFDHRRLWVLRTATVRRLEVLERRIALHDVGGAEQHDLQACLALLEEIVADDQRAWARMRDTDGPSELEP